MDFNATRISTEEFTPEKIQTILADARVQIDQEREQLQLVLGTFVHKSSRSFFSKLTNSLD